MILEHFGKLALHDASRTWVVRKKDFSTPKKAVDVWMDLLAQLMPFDESNSTGILPGEEGRMGNIV